MNRGVMWIRRQLSQINYSSLWPLMDPTPGLVSLPLALSCAGTFPPFSLVYRESGVQSRGPSHASTQTYSLTDTSDGSLEGRRFTPSRCARIPFVSPASRPIPRTPHWLRKWHTSTSAARAKADQELLRNYRQDPTAAIHNWSTEHRALWGRLSNRRNWKGLAEVIATLIVTSLIAAGIAIASSGPRFAKDGAHGMVDRVAKTLVTR